MVEAYREAVQDAVWAEELAIPRILGCPGEDFAGGHGSVGECGWEVGW